MSDPSNKVAVSKSNNAADLGYDPQGDGIGSADAFFSSVAPGVANSGNLAHKDGAEGDHSISTPSPSNLKGD